MTLCAANQGKRKQRQMHFYTALLAVFCALLLQGRPIFWTVPLRQRVLSPKKPCIRLVECLSEQYYGSVPELERPTTATPLFTVGLGFNYNATASVMLALANSMAARGVINTNSELV